MEVQKHKNALLILGIGLVAIVLVVALSFTTQSNEQKQEQALENSEEIVAVSEEPENSSTTSESTSVPSTAGSNSTESTGTEPNTSAEATQYKNGTYSQVGTYNTPGGSENINVNLTLQDNIIHEVEVELTPAHPTSKNFMDIFSENYKQYVVGKNINEIQLDKVSGSSLTPQGFNDALEKIKTEAKV